MASNSTTTTVPPAVSSPIAPTTVPPVVTSPPPIQTTPDVQPTDPALPTSTRGGGGKNTIKTRPTDATTVSGGVGPTQTPPSTDGGSGKKSIIAPVVGSIAGVLVVAFIVAVFVMRYKKKSRARKRRLDFLDHSGTGTDAAIGGTGAATAAIVAPHRPTSDQSPAGRSSTPGGARPLEMATIGGSTLAASQHHNDGYDYQQGYQQVPYGGHTEQYDPYYDQRQHQAQGYYADQQQGYYPEEQQYHNQYAPSTPHNGTASVSLGSSSPSTTLVGASPMSYPQPPPAMSSPRTSTQSAVPVAPGGPSYLNNAKVENNAHSPLRNPQLVPENEERIKVPI